MKTMKSVRQAMCTAVCVAAALLVVGTAQSAFAQPGGGGGGGRGPGGGMMFGGMGGGGGLEASVTKQQLERYGKVLKLSTEQAQAAAALLEGMDASLKPKQDAARKVMEDAREEFRESRDPSVWQTVGEKMTKLREERTAAEKQFFDDMKQLLTPEQVAMWPKVERERRREKVMGQGVISGERADLVKIVSGMKLADASQKAVEPILDSYEAELDPILVKRGEVTEKFTGQQGRLRELMMGGGGDTSEINKLFEEGREAAIRVRDANRRYAKQIEGALLAEEQSKFTAEFKKESYPQIYGRPGYGTQVLEAVAKMELDATAKKSIEGIKEEYDRTINALREKAAQSQDEQAQTATLQSMMASFMGSEDMRKFRESSRDLDTKVVDQVKALLTPEQIAKLPERRGGGDNGPGGGNGRGGGAGGNGGGAPTDAGNGGGNQRRNRNGGGGQSQPAQPK